MATLTVSSGDFIRPHLGYVRLDHYPEAATQTFKKGAPLIRGVAAGKENQAKVSTTDAVLGFLGIAADDASGVEGTDLTIWVAEPGVEFVARVQDTGVLAYTSLGPRLWPRARCDQQHLARRFVGHHQRQRDCRTHLRRCGRRCQRSRRLPIQRRPRVRPTG
jgi:hypothetical protein